MRSNSTLISDEVIARVEHQSHWQLGGDEVIARRELLPAVLWLGLGFSSVMLQCNHPMSRSPTTSFQVPKRTAPAIGEGRGECFGWWVSGLVSE